MSSLDHRLEADDTTLEISVLKKARLNHGRVAGLAHA